MASLTEQVKQVAQTSQQIAQQKAEVQKQRFPQRSLRFQQEIISRQPSYYAGRTERLKEATKTKRRIGLSQLGGAEAEVQQTTTELVKSAGSISEIEKLKTGLTKSEQAVVNKSLSSIKAEQQKKISSVQSLIDKNKQAISQLRSRGRSDDIDREIMGHQIQIEKYREGLSNLKSGQLLSLGDVRRYAEGAASAKLKASRDKEAKFQQVASDVGKEEARTIFSTKQISAQQLGGLSQASKKLLGVSTSKYPTQTQSTVFKDGLGYSVAPEYQASFKADITKPMQSSFSLGTTPKIQKLTEVKMSVSPSQYETKTTPTTWKEAVSKSGLAFGSLEYANIKVSEKVTKPAFGFIEEKTGTPVSGWLKGFSSLGTIEYDRPEERYTPLAKKLGVEKVETAISSSLIASPEFKQGVATSILTDIRDKPVTQGAIYGGGYLVGGVAGGVVKGASKVSPLFGTTAKVGIVGAGIVGTSYAGYDIYSQLSSAESDYEKGSIIGSSGKNLLLFGLGASQGAKGFEKLSGWWGTRGRDFIPLEKLTPAKVISGEKSFPTAPASQQLSLFEKNVAGRYLNEPAGAFHATPEKFWSNWITGKTITPQAGTSELPGLYGSSYISPYFSGLKGGSSYKTFGLSITSGSSPAVAYLKPKGFRIARWGGTPKKPTLVKGVRVKDYSFWKTPVKEGYADLPLMKPEIEAIFRVGSGTYGFESGRFFTKIEGVRVPIDVFGFKGGATTTGGAVANIGGVKLSGGSSSYSLTKPTYSIITPESFAGSYLISSKKSSYPLSSYLSSIKNIYSSTPSSTKSKKYYPISYKSSSKSYSLSPSSSYFSSTLSSKKSSYSSSSSSYVPSSKRFSSSSVIGKLSWKNQPKKTLFPRERKLSQPLRYTPSFTGLVFSFKAKQKPKKVLGGYSFGIRPTITTGSLKRSKKSIL